MENISPVKSNKTEIIKNIYLYLVSFVGLMMIAISASNLVSTALRAYVFTKADFYGGSYVTPACDPYLAGKVMEDKTITAEKCAQEKIDMEKSRQENRIADLQRSTVNTIPYLITGSILFFFHWRLARKKE